MNDTLSSSLAHYFQHMLGAGRSSTPTVHVIQGADCISASDMVSIHSLLESVNAKAASIVDSARLRQRIEVLARFLEESPDGAVSTAHREAAFVLFYFIKGNDLIPDSVPEIGLLDDAVLVETVVNRNLLALRAHWEDHQRVWPENL